jgi:hypothetical protein
LIKLFLVCLVLFLMVGSIIVEAPVQQMESTGGGSSGYVTVIRKKPKPHGSLTEALFNEG